jgi:hypothetical protein
MVDLKRLLRVACLLLAAVGSGCDDDDDEVILPPTPTTFTLRIENPAIPISGGETRSAVPLAPGVWAISTEQNALYTEGQPDRGDGLEAIAEDGNPAAAAAALSEQSGVTSSGVFETPVGELDPGPIGPGGAYEVTFDALPGTYLSFATMYVESNDIFLGPAGSGIQLFNNGTPIRGGVTGLTRILDAGTEINEEPGGGPNQAPRQSGPDTGPTEGLVQPVDDGWSYPDDSTVVRVSISSVPSGNDREFNVIIENRSTMFDPYPMSPGVWAVHTASGPLFKNGQPDPGLGLEALAEDGDPTQLAASLAGQAGIEASGVFDTPVGSGTPGVLTPGNSYEFSFIAGDGDFLSLATMLVPTNDLFYAPGEDGIALFEGGTPISGDITGEIGLRDAGTEINEEPGVGPNQAPRQSAPDTGPQEGVVQTVRDSYDYGQVADLIQVTLTLEP